MDSALKLLPDDVSEIWCIDIEKLQSDRNMNELLDDFLDKVDSEEMEDAIGVYPLDLSIMIIASSDNGLWLVFKGDFDPDDVRFALEDMDFEEDQYRDIEVWDGDFALAFIDDMVVISEDMDSIRKAIRLNEGSGSSVYDDEYYGEIIDRLPSGVITILSNAGAFNSRADGIVINSLTSGALEFTGWYIFSSERRAEANLFDIEDEMEYMLEAIFVDANQHGELVEITGELDIDDFIESNFWSGFGFYRER